MTQDEIRKDIETVHTIFGTPYSFFAKKIGSSNPTLSMFVRSQRDISEEKQKALEVILKELKGRY